MNRLFFLIITIALTMTLSGCSFQSTSLNLEHLNNSLELSNQASVILKQYGENIRQEQMNEIINLKKQALAEARLVDIQLLNNHYDNFGNQWRDKYLNGLTLFIQGIDERSNEKSLQGQVLLDEWGNWYSDNINEIRKK